MAAVGVVVCRPVASICCEVEFGTGTWLAVCCGGAKQRASGLALELSPVGRLPRCVTRAQTASQQLVETHPCAIKWIPWPSLFSEPLFPLSPNIPSRTSSTSVGIDQSIIPVIEWWPSLVVSAGQASPLCSPVAKITRVVLARLLPAQLQRRTH